MSSRNENLAKNTLLFAIGNLGSKLLQVILVPYYTRCMTDAQFGTADLLTSIVTLLMPIFSLTIYEAVFRYAMEKDYDKQAVFSSGIVVSVIGAAVLCLGAGVVSLIHPVEYIWLVVAYSVAGFMRSLFSQFTRAVDKTFLFTIDNVLLTFFVFVFNITFLSGLKLGVTGYMLGYTLANVVSCVFLFIFLGKQYRRFSTKNITSKLMKEMLMFAIPLIPNSICWWISSFIDRLVITSVEGEAANGIYAAAHKIPSLLTMVVTIFFQAWQISANQEFEKKDITDFYTEIHSFLFSTVTLISSVLILLCKPITSVFLGKDFYSAWELIPLMLFGMTCFSFAMFLGSIYSANKKTTMALVTNLVAVVISLSVNILLVAYFKTGVIGSAIALCCSYLAFWIARVFDTARIVKIHYPTVKVIFVMVMLLADALIYTFVENAVIVYPFAVCTTAIIAVLFWKDYISLVKFGLSLIKKFVKRS